MGFLFGFLLFHSIVFLCFFFSFFCILKKHSLIVNERKMNIDCDGYVLGFLYVDLTSVEHSSLGFTVWNGEVYIACNHMWFHMEEKTKCLGFLKDNMDSYINFCLVFILKTCLSKGLRFFMIKFDTFVKHWVHIWENNTHLWNIQFHWKIGLQCPWCG